MTDRTHPDSGRITTSGDVINDLHDRIAELEGTRKVLWNLLGECLPLLKVDAQWSTDYEGKEAIESLIERIESARVAVQAEELPERGKKTRFVSWACPVCAASVERGA
jgi:hypothetical protein